MMWASSAATIALGVSLSLSTSACSPPLWGMAAWMFILTAMSGPPGGTSSGAAQAREEGFVVRDDADDGRRVRRRVPLVELESPAENDPVGPREHVAGAAGEGILDVGLRLEDCQLATRRVKVLIAEQFAAA